MEKRVYTIIVGLTFLIGGLACSHLFAQSFQATLTGSVTDTSGGVLQNVSVVVINLRTNQSARVLTDETGLYRAFQLQPSDFQVTMELPGFKTFQSHITLTVGQAARLDAVLEIGSATETVEVSATAPLLESESGSFGQVIEHRFVEDLPLNERNPFAFVALVPGVFTQNNFTDRNVFTSQFSANGGRASTNEVLLDGAPDTVGDFNGVAHIPPVDSTQEFRVQTNPYSAEFGRTGGAVVNVVTKSGSNLFHGSVYEFMRNSALDANTWQNNRDRLCRDKNDQRIPCRPGFQRHQFGFNFGGPVRLPGLYNGKNRTFFFVDFEGLRQGIPSSGTLTVPTEAERRGDFSNTFIIKNGQPTPVKIFNPFSGIDSGGRYIRDAFPDNRINIPIHPAAQRILQYIPLPNRAADCAEDPRNCYLNFRNYAYATTVKRYKDIFDIKADHAFSGKHGVSGRFSWSRIDADRAVNKLGNPAGYNLGQILDIFHNIMLNDTYTFNAGTLMNNRLAYTRYRANQRPATLGFDPTSLGLPSLIKDQAAVLYFPNFYIGGIDVSGSNNTLGGAGYNNQPRDTFSAQGNLTRTRKRHALKIGYEYRLIRFNAFQTINATGSFSFDKTLTAPVAGPGVRVEQEEGYSLASFLLGVGSANMEIRSPVTLGNTYYAFYLQDDYKVSKDLILNLGLRWDSEIGTGERYNRIGYFDPSPISPIADRVDRSLFLNNPELRGVFQFVGEGNPSATRRNIYHNFGPRFGFAYRVSDHLVVRGGYGIFFLPFALRQEVSDYGSANSTSWASLRDGLHISDTIGNVFGDGLSRPQGRAIGTMANLGNGIIVFRRDEQAAYAQQFNLGVQRTIGQNLSIEAQWSGNRGVRLPVAERYNINALDGRYYALGEELVQRVPNPFYNVLPRNSSLGASSTLQRWQLLVAYPQYGGVQIVDAAIGNSIYHSLQFKMDKRFSRGYNFLISFTGGKLISDSSHHLGFLDDGAPWQTLSNRRAERSVSPLDASRRLVMSFTAQLPIGQGRPLGRHWGPRRNGLLGGWQLNGIYSAQNGRPLRITGVTDNRRLPGTATRPNTDGTNIALPSSQRNMYHWFYNDDRSMFSDPAPYQIGNLGRFLPNVRGPGFQNYDLSLFKNFQVQEQVKLQFRAELFNAFNIHPLGTPETNYNSPLFGKIDLKSGRREVQFALKLLF
ncbi:MAG: TonB-dependent receptor [Acidobacteria bacterium]|nr:TonB-dependent receptor [Acidobacteriota bacterium]MBI3655003.1 TonB-dependent receptor [Acidobacteriota bacterium]